MEYRIERDTLGEVMVPASSHWGAQTQRSYENFKIGIETMPLEVVHGLTVLKKAAAIANNKLGKLSDEKCKLITEAADQILSGEYDDQFPLKVWQTGSGTQSNMNVNEVIAHLANDIAGENIIHPNDDVNKSQSSNDTFPSAMHISAALLLKGKLVPNIIEFINTLERLEKENEGIIKIGRTHLQDAVPITFSQEISAWRSMMLANLEQINSSIDGLRKLAIGGTAVGTGLNAPDGFSEMVCDILSKETGFEFKSKSNKFHALTGKDALVFSHGALKALAANMMKIANDVRWLASGPRCGIGEISIPENEPGSSIMPGKVNPTQSEAVTMVAVQVMGNDTTIGIAASQGNFQLNVFMPAIIYNFIQSTVLLADSIKSFNDNCAIGIKANKDKMSYFLENSLMLVTALNTAIGYESAAKIAKYAFENDLSLKEAALKLEILDEATFNELVDPSKMV
ncbi:MAG: class II fumarate hydratase [Tissierellia bacterium]|nr:class II fumarate hydratase [Tissierellia bacterium]